MNNEYGNNNYENYDNNNMEVESHITSEETISGGSNPKQPKGHKGIPTFMKVASTALVFGLVAGMTFQGFNYVADYRKKNTEITETPENKVYLTQNKISEVSSTANSVNTTNDVSTVAENVMPSIVAITATSTQDVQDIFGRVYSNEATGSGSGIIIGQNDTEVLIATNNHVVEGASQLSITFIDDETASATLKGTDSANDLAVVSVKLNDLKADTKSSIKIATLGDSDALKVGEMSIAIGNALGYGQSVTVGYISALNRKVSVEDNTMTLLQTDAAINPGNSGGALLNAKGEVIGINSVKFASSEVEGMGYAIPINYAVPIISDLMNREVIPEDKQAYLGIRGLDVTSQDSESYNMPQGVYVGEVTSGSPADKAGLYAGSIITKYNGKDAKTMEQLQSQLSATKAGSKAVLTVQVLENGKYNEKTIEVNLGSKADAQTEAEPSENQGNGRGQRIPNITIPYVN